MDYANIPLALFAGLFSILSPCVLPLAPVVLGTAVSEHRLGPLALAAGLATSFTAIGLFVATIGYSIGFDGEFFKVTGAVLLVAAGFALSLPRLQIRLALAAAPFGNWTERKFGTAASGALAYYSARSGVHAWGPPWAPPPFSLLRAGAWVWLRSPCCPLVSEARFP
jgi:cytochrome c biogenesis protein CcdA